MSGKTVFDAIDCDGLSPAAKLTLVALADRADEAGVCWPSRNDLKARTGLSDSTLTRQLRKLERGSWIQRRQRRDKSTIYRVNLVKIERCAVQVRQTRKLRRAGDSWEKFPEEVVTQPIENAGDAHNDQGYGHSDQGYGHSDQGYGHSEHLISQEPLKESTAANPSPSRSLPLLTAFQASRIRAGSDVVVDGSWLRSGTQEAHAALRMYDRAIAEKGQHTKVTGVRHST